MTEERIDLSKGRAVVALRTLEKVTERLYGWGNQTIDDADHVEIGFTPDGTSREKIIGHTCYGGPYSGVSHPLTRLIKEHPFYEDLDEEEKEEYDTKSGHLFTNGALFELKKLIDSMIEEIADYCSRAKNYARELRTRNTLTFEYDEDGNLVGRVYATGPSDLKLMCRFIPSTIPFMSSRRNFSELDNLIDITFQEVDHQIQGGNRKCQD